MTNYQFELPEIRDSVLPIKQVPSGRAPPDAYTKIHLFTELRNHFKGFFKDKFPVIKATKGDSILSHIPEMENYLNTHLEIWGVLAKNQELPINFSWSNFLTPGSAQMDSVNLRNEEVIAAEIIMTRFMFAIAIGQDCQKDLGDLRAKLIASFKKDPAIIEGARASVKDVLNKYETAIEKLNKLSVVAQDLFVSLPNLAAKYFELTPFALEIVKTMLQINASFIFFDFLRLAGESQMMVSVAKGLFDRLEGLRAVLKGREQFVRQDLLNHLEFSSTFAKALGMYALMRFTETELKSENFARKKYNGLVTDLVYISDDLVKIRDGLYAKKGLISLDNFSYCMSYFEQEMLVIAANHKLIYGPSVTGPAYPGEQPFLDWKESADYFESKQKIKRQ